ncbi:MAG: LysR family transcriptional regulator [Rhodopseudomonas sp.]|nr:LysR family transcriptional regulator [Rhodopseudomonas sp.]
MDLRQLRYFAMVAEELSFTRAAARLRISQPPLSQQIKELEDSLGTTLFRRTSRRVELTEAGKTLVVHGRNILAQVDATQRKVRAVGQGRVGELSIGATGSIMRGGLADLLAAHRHEYPGVVTKLVEQAPELQMMALLEHRTDVCFIRSPPAHDGLTQELAWREDVVVAMSAIHRLAKRKRIEIKDLREEEYIVLAPDSSDFARSIIDWCVAAGFLPRIAHEVIDSQSILGLIAAGFGVALLPASIARLTGDQIIFHTLGPTAPAADVFLVYRQDDPSPVLRAFIEFARRQIRGARPPGKNDPLKAPSRQTRNA